MPIDTPETLSSALFKGMVFTYTQTYSSEVKCIYGQHSLAEFKSYESVPFYSKPAWVTNPQGVLQRYIEKNIAKAMYLTSLSPDQDPKKNKSVNYFLSEVRIESLEALKVFLKEESYLFRLNQFLSAQSDKLRQLLNIETTGSELEEIDLEIISDNMQRGSAFLSQYE